MEFRTKVDIAPSAWQIEPCEALLCVGSCFADAIGARFQQELFRAMVNPYGVMYNPLSVLHTVERCGMPPAYTIVSLGTNHVYVDRATGEVVDNCQKRPASDFEERVLSVDECAAALAQVVESSNKTIVTVSPIRYKKYGFPASNLSKGTLLLAADAVVRALPGRVEYFPSYEIVVDELRDYRFYAADMLHPTAQATEYIFSRFAETYFSPATHAFLKEWQPLRAARAHRPLHPESDEYKAFAAQTAAAIEAFKKKYSAYDILFD